VKHDPHVFDVSVVQKEVSQSAYVRVERQVAHEDVVILVPFALKKDKEFSARVLIKRLIQEQDNIITLLPSHNCDGGLGQPSPILQSVFVIKAIFPKVFYVFSPSVKLSQKREERLGILNKGRIRPCLQG
jgi:hypothetical protein